MPALWFQAGAGGSRGFGEGESGGGVRKGKWGLKRKRKKEGGRGGGPPRSGGGPKQAPKAGGVLHLGCREEAWVEGTSFNHQDAKRSLASADQDDKGHTSKTQLAEVWINTPSTRLYHVQHGWVVSDDSGSLPCPTVQVGAQLCSDLSTCPAWLISPIIQIPSDLVLHMPPGQKNAHG